MIENSTDPEPRMPVVTDTCFGCSLLCDDITKATECVRKTDWLNSARQFWNRANNSARNTAADIDHAVSRIQEANSTGIILGSSLSVETCREVSKLATAMNASVFRSANTALIDWKHLATRYTRQTCTIGEINRRADLICFVEDDLNEKFPRLQQRLIGKNRSDENPDSGNPQILTFGKGSDSGTAEQKSSEDELTYQLSAEFIQQLRISIQEHRKKRGKEALQSHGLEPAGDVSNLAEYFCNSRYAIMILDPESDRLSATKLHQLLKLAEDLRPETRLHILTTGDCTTEDVFGWNDMTVHDLPRTHHDGTFDEYDLLVFVGDFSEEEQLVSEFRDSSSDKILIGQIGEKQIQQFKTVIATPMEGTTMRQTSVRFDGVPVISAPFLNSESTTTTAEILSIVSSRLMT